ncbi:MAG TPA: GGDEF domain-containing protein [Blastocatellia bacterium]|nr:GGDEF domain-containing protein [Blastocatellia bacterium]
MYPIMIFAIIFFIPFSINDILHGRSALGIMILAVVVTLGIDVIALYLKKEPPIPFALLLAPMALGMAMSLRTKGIYGALWCYPALLFSYFVLSRLVANVCNVILLAVTTPMVYLYLGLGVTLRFFASATLTVIIVNTILKIIGELQRQLLDQAITDPLTGAFNRRHMETCLSDTIERNKRTGAPASILIVDVDHFKQINDRFGHESGDIVLKGMVSVINRYSRRLDMLFRMGGEEFALLLPDTLLADAVSVAEQLREIIANSALLGDWPISVSIGVSELRANQTMDAWLKVADESLYQAKKTGRNRVVYSEFAMSKSEELSPFRITAAIES